jgi:propanediol dehydratase small subunit
LQEESPWEDGRDPRSGKRFWKNKATGEITYDNPLTSGMKKEDMTVAQQKLLEAKAKMAEKKAGGRGAKRGR